jgi:hypothetical protein
MCIVLMVLSVEGRTFLHQVHRDFSITLYNYVVEPAKDRLVDFLNAVNL